MNFEMPDFIPAIPEIYMVVMACIILLVDVYVKDDNKMVTYLLSQFTLMGAAILTVSLHISTPEVTFNGTFIRDGMGDILKVFVYLLTAVTFIYSREYLRARNLLKGAFFTLSLFAVIGMMVLISAHSLLTVYLGLELLSLALYALVAINRDSQESTEAAMKYFVLGAIASGMLLYGMSLVYGSTGSLDIAEISTAVAAGSQTDVVLLLGMVFLIVGLAFKLGAVPFHMWLPDVYQGAITPVTLFIGTAPQLAAFAMVMRILVDSMGSLSGQWQDMLIMLAMLSIALGNVIAIAQTNIKRMLAYSTISHVGFLLLGVLSGTIEGYSAAMFYVLIYTLMTLGAFGMIILLTRNGFESDKLEDFRGLNERSPWFAFIMLIIMFSMAGVPPAVGFFAKLSVLTALVNSGLVWLAVYAVIFSVIGAFYYLRVIKFMYFDKPTDNSPLTMPFDMRAVLSVNGLVILALGIYPTALMALCSSVMS